MTKVLGSDTDEGRVALRDMFAKRREARKTSAERTARELAAECDELRRANNTMQKQLAALPALEAELNRLRSEVAALKGGGP